MQPGKPPSSTRSPSLPAGRCPPAIGTPTPLTRGLITRRGCGSPGADNSCQAVRRPMTCRRESGVRGVRGGVQQPTQGQRPGQEAETTNLCNRTVER